MSSHHIIRDEQEPALILEDLDSFPIDLLGQLLEWAPFTICGNYALDQALEYGINLDVVISSRQGLNELLAHFPGVIALPNQDDWQFQAMNLLKDRGHNAVNMVTRDPFDRFGWMHQVNEKILLDVITSTTKYIWVEKEFKKWMMAGQSIELADGHSLIINEKQEPNPFLTKKEGMITVSSNHAPFIIGLSL